MKRIEVLGPGCRNCEVTYNVIREAARQVGVEVEMQKVTDIARIVAYGVMHTPGVAIDGKVVHMGGIPGPDRVRAWRASSRTRGTTLPRVTSPRTMRWWSYVVVEDVEGVAVAGDHPQQRGRFVAEQGAVRDHHRRRPPTPNRGCRLFCRGSEKTPVPFSHGSYPSGQSAPSAPILPSLSGDGIPPLTARSG